jgi:uncharacterized protein YecT (DUF1311 family)
MKMLVLISFAIFTSVTSFGSVGNAEAAPGLLENECEGASQMENAECVGMKLNIADQELTVTYNALRARLAPGAELGGKSLEENAEIDRRLVKSQLAWAAFREADCSLEGAEMLGGNAEGARIQSCELAKTTERLRELREASL